LPDGQWASTSIRYLDRVTRRPAEDNLLRTACEVIIGRGLANTRTADIAEAAGVSQALLFYHFATKERLVAAAFGWAAEQDLRRLDAIVGSQALPLDKVRRVLRWYAPGSARPWARWIECWAESLRRPELEVICRRLGQRWKDALADIIATGVKDGDFSCADPTGAAWRILSLIDGLAVVSTVHTRQVSRRHMGLWIRQAAASELGLAPGDLA
jgi:AcrR family transcriptional regulator